MTITCKLWADGKLSEDVATFEVLPRIGEKVQIAGHDRPYVVQHVTHTALEALNNDDPLSINLHVKSGS